MNAFVEMRRFLTVNGQLFIKRANKKILIIDNYIGDSVKKCFKINRIEDSKIIQKIVNL